MPRALRGSFVEDLKSKNMLNVPGECEMRIRCRENSRKGIEHNRERKKAGSSLVQEEYTGISFTVFNFTTANHNHTLP